MFTAVDAIFSGITTAAVSFGRFFKILDNELEAIEISLESTKEARYAALLSSD